MNKVLSPFAEPILQLEKGDVAVVIRAGLPGEIEIRHNILSLEETRTVSQERGDAAGVVMALSLMELMENDEIAMAAAVTRALTGLGCRRLFAVG